MNVRHFPRLRSVAFLAAVLAAPAAEGLPGSPPSLAPIDEQTVLFGETLQVALVVEDIESIDDPLIFSNITIKAGTTAPEGENAFEDGCLFFTPNTNDIGQTFIFTASATDSDGTTNQDFNVTVGLAAPDGVEPVAVQTTEDLLDAMLRLCPDQDIVIQAAAPADFRPVTTAAHKIKKDGSGMALELAANPDIAAQLGRDKHEGQILVAFAAETDDLIENAQKKLAKKNADMVVAHDVTMPGAGFGVSTNRVTLITREDRRSLPLMSKRDVADAILDRVLELMRA